MKNEMHGEVSLYLSGTEGFLVLTKDMSGARAEGARCNTEILINRRLLSDAITEERLKGGWPSVLWFLASFVP